MSIKSIKNITLNGAENKQIGLDIFYDEALENQAVVIYAHGFNGFKDWGNFDLIAIQFAQHGFTFIKFNFSHNGTTIKNPEGFTDLEAFGNNNYTKQLNDLKCITNWVCDIVNRYQQFINVNKIALIGHSMGGGIAILFAAEDKRINNLITWASISMCKTPWGNWPKEQIQAWKNAGVEYYINGRTKQNMPLYYQLYEDFEQHKERLDIAKAIASLNIPILTCHGTLDTSVPMENAIALWKSQPNAELFTIEGNHVFNRKHPWENKDLPFAMQLVVDKSVQFLKMQILNEENPNQ